MTLQTLVSAAELADLIRDTNVLVVDCRFELSDPLAGAIAHAEAHVPGAQYASLDRDLSDLSKTGLGRHPLPDDAAFSATLARWGWTPDRAIVAYDDAGGALAAARLWWMLRTTGHDNVAVLDGGFSAWRAAGLPVESKLDRPTATPMQVALDVSRRVDFAELESRRTDARSLVLDARGAPRYRGDVEPIDSVAGHVPGAQNRPFSENLAGDGRFKPAAQLRDEFAHLLDGRQAADVVHMCGSGVTACHNLLAMEHAGLHGSRVFAPSWSGWISDPKRPVTRGPAADGER